MLHLAASTPIVEKGSRMIELYGGRRLRAAAGELTLAVLVATTVSVATQLVIDRLPLPKPSNLPSVVIMVGGGAALVVLVAVVGSRWRSRWSLPLAWLALPTAVTVTLAAVLGGSRYYLGGTSNDQSFRTEYLTRLASSPRLADFAYAHLPPYYPAGWFWLAGRFASVAGLPGWAAFKPFAILSLAVISVVCFWLWSLSVPRRTALLLAATSTVLGMTLGSSDSTVAVTEPYSWLAVLTIPPLAVLAWRMFSAQGEPEPVRGGYPTAVVLGVLVGVYGVTYTLYFLFAVLVLVLLAAAVVLRHEWCRRKWYRRKWYRSHDATGEPTGTGPTTRTLLLRLAGHAGVLAVPALLVLLPAWAPYLLGVLGGSGMGSNVASHFLPSVGASFPLPFLHASPTGALCMIGLLWLVVAVLSGSRYRAVACALAATVAGCYLWYLLSVLALLADTTLLAFRIEPILVVALVSAGGIAVLEAMRAALPRLAERWRPAARAVPALLGLAVLLAQLQGFPQDNAKVINDAFEDYYPTGHTASGESNPADSDAWVPQLVETIHQLSGTAPDRNVVAGSDPELLFDTHPYWRFQAATNHYANPLSDYRRRNELLRDWSKASEPAALHAELADSPVAAPTVFVFQHSGSKLITRVNTDTFPRNPNVAFNTVTFDRAQFTASAFASRDVGPFTVVAVSSTRPA